VTFEGRALSSNGLKHRLAAILAADVVGYSRLMAEDDSATVVALDEARALFQREIQANAGRVFDMAGDSVMAIFETATGAVAAALDLQRELGNAPPSVTEQRRMRFRIGLHMGDVIEKTDGTIYGDGVNIAARLESLADPGGVMVSGIVHDTVRARIAAHFEDFGEHKVKNIPYPVHAYKVGPKSDAALVPAHPAAPVPSVGPRMADSGIDLSLPKKPSIAVMAFTNMSGDPEQEYFTDGITEDIIVDLSRFKSLFVLSRSSSFLYKGRSCDAQQIGREMGVRYVLNGSIRRAGGLIRVSGYLTDAASGDQIWAERYDRKLEDIFEVQEELTTAIVTAIAPKIEAAERHRAARLRPGNLGAYDLALRAWAHCQQSDAETNAEVCLRAVDEARQALAIDPNCVHALTALAVASTNARVHQFTSHSAEALAEGMNAARKAVALDGSDAVALACKVVVGFSQVRIELYDDLLHDARRAYELNPNISFVLSIYSMVEAYAGNPERAITLTLELFRLNPSGLGLWMPPHHVLAVAAFSAKRYRDGIRWGLRAVHDFPQLAHVRIPVIGCYVGVGDIDQAKAVFATQQKLAPGYTRSRLNGKSLYRQLPDRQRLTAFLRIAAGLDDPEGAAALR